MRKDKHVILCVDDDPDILPSLRVVLEFEGYQVETAAPGSEGLDEYGRTTPDVVIVDLMMEEVDAGTPPSGDEVARSQGAGVPPQFDGRLPERTRRRGRARASGSVPEADRARRCCCGSSGPKLGRPVGPEPVGNN